jgi:hypothetical protein
MILDAMILNAHDFRCHNSKFSVCAKRERENFSSFCHVTTIFLTPNQYKLSSSNFILIYFLRRLRLGVGSVLPLISRLLRCSGIAICFSLSIRALLFEA